MPFWCLLPATVEEWAVQNEPCLHGDVHVRRTVDAGMMIDCWSPMLTRTWSFLAILRVCNFSSRESPQTTLYLYCCGRHFAYNDDSVGLAYVLAYFLKALISLVSLFDGIVKDSGVGVADVLIDVCGV